MKKKIVYFYLLFTLSFFISTPLVLAADPTLEGLDDTASNVDAFRGQTGSNFQASFLQTKAGEIISTVLSFVGVLFLILMIYAGITWMTAQGNEQQITKAKGLLINAIIGIIIVFAAYALTAFLGEQILK